MGEERAASAARSHGAAAPPTRGARQPWAGCLKVMLLGCNRMSPMVPKGRGANGRPRDDRTLVRRAVRCRKFPTSVPGPWERVVGNVCSDPSERSGAAAEAQQGLPLTDCICSRI
jgi:hypothetical protein